MRESVLDASVTSPLVFHWILLRGEPSMFDLVLSWVSLISCDSNGSEKRPLLVVPTSDDWEEVDRRWSEMLKMD